jgi:NTF2 fold immunity protein
MPIETLKNSVASELVQFVCAFTREMNEWERDFEAEWSEHEDTYVHNAPDDAMSAYRLRDQDIQAKYRARYVDVFTRYCAQRKRVYGGPEGPLSAGMPTKYQGVDESSYLSIEGKSASRSEVFFQTNGPVVDYKFLFVLLKKNGSWKIDGYKYQFRGSVKWESGIL